MPSSNNVLGTLGSLTQGTSLQQTIQILQLLNNLNQLHGEVTAIPNDILTALNSTANILGTTVQNVTDMLLHELQGKRDVNMQTRR